MAIAQTAATMTANTREMKMSPLSCGKSEARPTATIRLYSG